MSKLYTSLEDNMLSRLEGLSNKFNIHLDSLINSYNHRRLIIEKYYSREYKGRESRILYYAYKGVEKDLEIKNR